MLFQDPKDLEALKDFFKADSGDAKLLYRIVRNALAELGDITNIDLKGDVALETASRVRACGIIKEIFDIAAKAKAVPEEEPQNKSWG
jgi:hypothetical protein